MKEFFENINFTFGTNISDIKPSRIIVSEDSLLSEKIENNIFTFDAPEHSKSSFYVIAVELTTEELFKVRRYIWNENKYDLFFIVENLNNEKETTLYYAKTNPRENEIKIASFKGRDEAEIENIKKWNFESGAFWLSYSNFLNKIKECKPVDEKLVEQLKQLKHRLNAELGKYTSNTDEIVQALIDRTLFIKFLEDNHIINSFFYGFYFPNKSTKKNVSYKTLLEERDIEGINLLFDRINRLFNNVLFQNPFIEKEYISNTVMDLICQAIQQHDWNTGQMSLFDFRFDVIPIEFISHIYEVFLEKKQLDEGIYYTPNKLAHLIIDDTILKQGTVLDPACGSGMFLVLAFRKLLKQCPFESKEIRDIINYRNQLIKDSIFGIEKSNIAWRLTVFSLYLEILKDIPADDIKIYIQQKIEYNSESSIFIDFSSNIVNCNALEIDEEKIPHRGKTFDFIVGNPPFFQISSDNEEVTFINEHSISINDEVVKAKDIIGYNQISQAFMLKLKDWAHFNTRFGFIQNSSNFYNEKSESFQEFFFTHYQIESFYELSRVKDVLFRKAKENVIVAIFSNNCIQDNIIKYYPVHEVLFSKIFELIVIQEDKRIDIFQKDILDKKIILREYLLGNDYDLRLLKKLSNNEILDSFLLQSKEYSFKGLQRITNGNLCKYFKIKECDFLKLNKKEKTKKHEEFAKERYLKEDITAKYNIPYIYRPENRINAFVIEDNDGFMSYDDINDDNFQRSRKSFIYKGNKILLNKFGRKIVAAFVDYDLIFSDLIYGIKLSNENYYHLFTAILNSDLINFYLLLKFRKRVDNNFSNIDTNSVKNIPIPKLEDKDLVTQIVDFSCKLTKRKLNYENQIKESLNELIYDLYDLDYLERQRVKDFFTENAQVSSFTPYINALFQTLEMYFQTKPHIEVFEDKNLGFDMVVVAIFINDAHLQLPSSKKVFRYIINKIIQENQDGITLLKEKIIGKDCIYLIKDKQHLNWTVTKAFEDGKDILKLMQ